MTIADTNGERTKHINAQSDESRLCDEGSREMLTCGLSCLNALNALFAKLVAVAIVDEEREGDGGGKDEVICKPGSTQGLIKESDTHSHRPKPSLPVTPVK